MVIDVELGTSVTSIGNTGTPGLPFGGSAIGQIDNGTMFVIGYDDPSPPTYKQWFQSPKMIAPLFFTPVTGVGTQMDLNLVGF